MTLRWMPACFAAVAAVSFTTAVVASIATGCTSNDVTVPASPPTQCPPTLLAANGSACGAGLLCPYEFLCGTFSQQTTCSCVNGALACVVDATDASLAVGAAPTCSPQTNPVACPANEPQTNDTCTAVGLTCLYKDLLCPGSEAGPNIDTCECQGGTNGGLVYDCVIDECGSSPDGGVGTPLDGNVPDEGAPHGDAGDGGDANDSGDDGG
jgi:hypothetical protein